MTCVNWSLTILAAIIFVFGVWPGYLGAGATNWIVGIAAVLIVLISWTGVECKPCAMAKAAAPAPKASRKKAKKKKRK